MSEARTKLDILYQDVLGDIKEILDHMDALKTGIPNALEGSIINLKVHSDTLSFWAEKLNQSVSEIIKKIDAYVTATALIAGNEVKNDVRQSVAECLDTLVYESLLPIIQKASADSEDSLKKLQLTSISIENKISVDAEKAIGRLNVAINSLQKAVMREAEKIEENKWEHIQLSAFGALFGTGAAIGISKILYILIH